MMIGDFQSTQDGFAGRIRTLTLDAAVTFVPAPANDSENAPDWRVLLGDADTGIEIGAGWNRTGERAGAYVAVQIDDPAFVQPLRANLLRSMGRHDEHHLLWSASPVHSAFVADPVMVFSIAVLTITAMYGVVPAVWQAWERQVSFGGQDKRTASRLVLCGWDDWQILYGKKPCLPYAALNSALFSTQNSMASRP